MSKKKYKIALIHCGFIYSGGGERIVLEEALGLRKLGYQVDVYAPTLDEKNCFPDLISKVHVKTFFPSFYKFPFSKAVRMIVSSLLAPLLAFRFRKYDIFLGANQPGAWIAYCMSYVLRKPYIVYLNQPNRIIYPRPVDVKYGWYTTVKDYQFLYSFLRIFRIPLEFLDRLSIRKSSSVMVNGEYIGGIIENIYSKEVVDNPAGSYARSKHDLLAYNDLIEGGVKIASNTLDKPYALITNRHDPQKRFDLVIDAMKLLVKKFRNLQLIIPGPYTNHTLELLTLTKKLGLEDRVKFIGTVSELELQTLYRNAMVYCYPSPEEDFGLGPLEAGGWGVPTVAWNNAGPTVTIDNGITGMLARPYDVNDYAQKMAKIVNNKRLRSTLGHNAWLRTKAMFSWDNHVTIASSVIIASIENYETKNPKA